jgi:hypothetical protein
MGQEHTSAHQLVVVCPRREVGVRVYIFFFEGAVTEATRCSWG